MLFINIHVTILFEIHAGENTACLSQYTCIQQRLEHFRSQLEL